MAIDSALVIFGGLCVIAGLLGSFLPVLPGPSLSYCGLLLLQLTSGHPFSAKFLVIYALLTILVIIFDYAVPVYGTKKLQGSQYGVMGSAAGLVAGLILLPPFGIVIGPFLGALCGELISGKSVNRAFQSALGAFLGFIAGTAVKFALSAVMGYHFAVNAVRVFSG